MKGAIATVDFFASNPDQGLDRLSLAIAAPERSTTGQGWECRVALANLQRARSLTGRDSIEALALALDQARSWIASLRAEGRTLWRDRARQVPFDFE